MAILIYLFLWILLAAFFIYPQLNLFFLVKFNDLIEIIQKDNTITAIINSLKVSFCVACLCTVLGVSLAWLLMRTDLPHRKNLKTWLGLPYAIPPFVGAIGWILLANPTSGILNSLFPSSANYWSFNIYSFWGLVFVEVSFLYSFVLINVSSHLEHIDASLEEAARLSGANGIRVFRDISLPLLRPTILSSFILSFLATAASFGVPALIGGPARIYLMTTQIYSYQKSGTEQSLKSGLAVSLILWFFALGVTYLNQLLTKKQKLFLIGGKATQPSLISLAKFKSFFSVGIYLFLLIVLGLPFFSLLVSAMSSIQGDWKISHLSFENFYQVFFKTEETLRALSQSLGLGMVASLLSTLFSFFLAFFMVRSQFKFRRIAYAFASLPYSTPGSVLALALILTMSRNLFNFGFSLYNTLWLILIAYVLKYTSLSLKTLFEAFEKIHPSLDEAARISGATWWRVLWTIYFPLLRPAIIASVFLVFIPSLSELTMSILLTGPGLETLGTLIFQLQDYSDVGGGGAAVLSIVVILFVVVLNFTLRKISQGRYGL